MEDIFVKRAAHKQRKLRSQFDEAQRIAIECMAFQLLRKFHAETDCGRPYHWSECEAFIDALGWDSWEAWNKVVQDLQAW